MTDQYVGPSEAPDRYHLVELVGRGGEGEVWRAETTSGPKETVAVKVVQPPEGVDIGSWSDAWRDRIATLRSEAQVGVVTVRESFLGPPPHAVTQADIRLRPTLVVVSDWVDGSNLRTWAASRTDGELRSAGFTTLVQVAAALDGLHSGTHTDGRPVTHLDLKPENVLVDRSGQAWLGDFGMARVLGGSITPTGYTPPEVRQGGAHWPASDRYALGGLAYFLATRRDPPLDPAPGQLRGDLISSPVLNGNQDAVDQVLVMLDPEPRNRPFPSRDWASGIAAALATATPPGFAAPFGAATVAGPGTPPPSTPPPATPPPTTPTPAAYTAPAAAYAGGYPAGPPGGQGPPPQPPAFGGGATPPPKKKRTPLVIAIVVVALAIIAAGVFVLTRDKSSNTGSGTSTDTESTIDTSDTTATDSQDTEPPATDAPETDAPTTRPTTAPTTVPVPAVCAKVPEIKAVTTEIQNASSSGNIDSIKAAIAHGAQIFTDLAAIAPPEIKADADFVAGSWLRYSQVVSAVDPSNPQSQDNLKAAVTTFTAENDGPQVKNLDAYLAQNC